MRFADKFVIYVPTNKYPLVVDNVKLLTAIAGGCTQAEVAGSYIHQNGMLTNESVTTVTILTGVSTKQHIIHNINALVKVLLDAGEECVLVEQSSTSSVLLYTDDMAGG